MRELLLIALFLACPLMMVFMMRGGHGHGRPAHGGRRHGREADAGESRSISELQRERDELDRLIKQREQEEEPTPVGGGWR